MAMAIDLNGTQPAYLQHWRVTSPSCACVRASVARAPVRSCLCACVCLCRVCVSCVFAVCLPCAPLAHTPPPPPLIALAHT